MNSVVGWKVGVVVLALLMVCSYHRVAGLICYECMNFAQGKFYAQCPLNGSVVPNITYNGNCAEGRCFTRTDDLNTKLVIRGCTGTQWGLPDPLPADGCYPWYREVWCVCSTDKCNGVKLGTPKSDDEFDSHIDYSKPKGTNGASLPSLSVAPAVVLLITGAAWLLDTYASLTHMPH